MSKHPTIKLVGGQKVPAVERYKEALQDIEELKTQVEELVFELQKLRSDYEDGIRGARQMATSALYVANMSR